jgi:hypothetical protein
VVLRESDALQMSFMQGLLASLAPLFVCTFVFLFMLDVIYNMKSILEIKILAGIVCCSLLFGSAPSGADINMIINSFRRNPEYSLFQIILGVLSILLITFVIDISFLNLPFEVFYYILNCLLVIGFYFVFKGSIFLTQKAILEIIHGVQKYREIQKYLIQSFFRRIIKPYSSKQKTREEVVR